jgi:hypothetical protein
VLSIAGLHVPVIPLVETAGKLNEPPEQMAGTWLKAGTTGLVTVTVMVAVFAHWPPSGVKVYVVVAVLLIDGDHEPVIELFDVVGSVNDPPEQIGEIWAKVGIVFAVTVITIALLVAVNGEAQTALLVITQVTLFALTRVVLVNEGLFVPTFVPFTFH